MMIKIKKALIGTVQFVAMVALSLIAAKSFAQELITIEQLQQAATGDPLDTGTRMLKGILGDEFASANPFSAAGATSTLIGDLFFVFNSTVLVIGCGFLGWIVISNIADSAQEGSPFSKNSSALWAPIRVGTGVLGALPVIGGFSVFQAITMTAIILGTGLANLMTGKLLDSSAAFKAITPSYSMAGAAPNMATDVENAANGIMLAEICRHANNHIVDYSPRASTRYLTPQWFEHKDRSGFDYGSCGQVNVSKRAGEETREESSYTSFRNASVNYSGIANAAQAAAVAEVKTLQREISRVVQNMYEQHDHGRIPPAVMAVGYAQMQAIERNARSRLNNSIAESVEDVSAIEQQVLQDIKNKGWMSLGSYYSVFSETSSALADAQRAFEISYVPGIAAQKIAAGDNVKNSIGHALGQFAATSEKQDPSSGRSWLDRVVDYFAPENEMGHRSIGQHIVNLMTQGIAADSGGAGLVNPVIAAKNLGDWMMIVGQAGVATGAAADVLPIGKGAKIAKKFSPALESLGSLLMTVMYIFIGLGMFLSIFVPMSIFAAWLSGILAYFTSILEALIYAQLAAFNHIRFEGQSFIDQGSGAHKFYLYLLNCLLRPGVMVIAFVLASALMTFIGTFLLESFSTAMASAQGNSTTGLLSIVGYLMLFCVMLFSVIQACTSLFVDLPDRLLGWIGGTAERSNSGALPGAAAGAAMASMRGGPTGGSARAAGRAVNSTTSIKS